MIKLTSLLIENKGSESDIPDVLKKMSSTLGITLKTPVQVSDPVWSVINDGKALYRVYTFSNYLNLRNFVSILLAYQQESNHHAHIEISKSEIAITLSTHDVNSITEQDTEMSEFLDDAYLDIGEI